MAINNRSINRVLKARDAIDTRKALLRGVHVLLAVYCCFSLQFSKFRPWPAVHREILDPGRYRTHTDDAELWREYWNSL